MAATERPPLRGASVDTRVLAVAGRRRPRAHATAWRARSRSRSARRAPARRPCGSRSRCARPATTSSSPPASCTREGLLRRRVELAEIKYCTDVELAEQAYNVVTVHLRRPFDAELVQRNFDVTSACGVCGKASIDSDRGRLRAARRGPRGRLRAVIGDAARASCATAQRMFERTGGLHAAGLFDARRASCSPARGRRPPQRARQADRQAPARRRGAAVRARVALVSGPRQLRARAEGGGRRHPRAVRGLGALQPRGRGRDAASA